MSACFYIVVEGEDPGYDIFVDGHALAAHEGELELYQRVREKTASRSLRWHLAVSWA